jgi:integrase
LHLSPFFARRRAPDITTDLLQRYVNHRRGEGASPASVNREMALLRRAFHLGHRATPPKVQTIPHFPMSREAEPRKGFLKPADYSALAQACTAVGGLWLRSVFEVAVSLGFRLHEMVGKNGLKVDQIDFVGNIIRLEITKNGEPREVFMTDAVRELLRQCCVGKSPKDHVFSRNGDPVITFHRSWRKACVLAGVAKLLCPECHDELDADRHCVACDVDWNAHETKYRGLLVHDLRRSAVRNLVRAGIPETVCQAISGHRSRSVFDRYNITSQSDLRDAARKLELHRAREVEQARAEQFGPSSGRVAPKEGQANDGDDAVSVRDQRPN